MEDSKGKRTEDPVVLPSINTLLNKDFAQPRDSQLNGRLPTRDWILRNDPIQGAIDKPNWSPTMALGTSRDFRHPNPLEDRRIEERGSPNRVENLRYDPIRKLSESAQTLLGISERTDAARKTDRANDPLHRIREFERPNTAPLVNVLGLPSRNMDPAHRFNSFRYGVTSPRHNNPSPRYTDYRPNDRYQDRHVDSANYYNDVYYKQSFQPYKVQQSQKEVSRRKLTDNPYCRECKTTKTPEWRRGPDGPRTLCNACGLIYAKQQRRLKKLAESAGASEDEKAKKDNSNDKTPAVQPDQKDKTDKEKSQKQELSQRIHQKIQQKKVPEKVDRRKSNVSILIDSPKHSKSNPPTDDETISKHTAGSSLDSSLLADTADIRLLSRGDSTSEVSTPTKVTE